MEEKLYKINIGIEETDEEMEGLCKKIEEKLMEGKQKNKLKLILEILDNIEEKNFTNMIEDEKMETYLKINRSLENKELKRQNKILEEKLKGKDDVLLDILKNSKGLQSAANKGKEGELDIVEYLNETYEDIKIVDNSKKTGEGDIWVTFPKYNCRMLIESKNKKTNTKEDVEKYIKDSIENNRDGRIDCSLYISYEDASIPEKGKIYFETIEDIHLGYISGVKNDSSKIKVMITTLIYFTKIVKQKEVKHGDIYNQLNEQLVRLSKYYKEITKEERIWKDMKGLISRSLKSINLFKNMIEEDTNRLYKYLQENEILLKEIIQNSMKTELSEKILIKETMIEYYKKHKKMATREVLLKKGFKAHNIQEYGGIKALQESIKPELKII